MLMDNPCWVPALQGADRNTGQATICGVIVGRKGLFSRLLLFDVLVRLCAAFEGLITSGVLEALAVFVSHVVLMEGSDGTGPIEAIRAVEYSRYFFFSSGLVPASRVDSIIEFHDVRRQLSKKKKRMRKREITGQK